VSVTSRTSSSVMPVTIRVPSVKMDVCSPYLLLVMVYVQSVLLDSGNKVAVDSEDGIDS
jgi:hypothetical protein